MRLSELLAIPSAKIPLRQGLCPKHPEAVFWLWQQNGQPAWVCWVCVPRPFGETVRVTSSEQ